MFGALACGQIEQKWSCWKGLWVYFPTQLEFLNLVVIFPSKIAISQDCFLCVKNVAESHFLLVFWLSGGPKLHKISCPWMSICNFSWQIWKCWVFAKWSCQDEGSHGGWDPLMEKTCKLPEKTKIYPKCSKFLGICAVARLFSALVLQWGLGQDMEGIGPFSPFLCFDQPPLEHLHLCLAHVHSRPIMVLHVSQQFFILVGLSQQPLQVSIEPDKHGLSLSRQ